MLMTLHVFVETKNQCVTYYNILRYSLKYLGYALANQKQKACGLEQTEALVKNFKK